MDLGLVAASCPCSRGVRKLGVRAVRGTEQSRLTAALMRKGRGKAELWSGWGVFLEPLPGPVGPWRGRARGTG